MEIYKIITDAEWVLPNGDLDLLDLLNFDCAPKLQEWPGLEWYVFNPKALKTNFFTISPGAFVFDRSVYDSDMFAILEAAGEILPIVADDAELFVLNVLQCYNVLDKEHTSWDFYENGDKRFIQEYRFLTHRFGESSVFKIKETSNAEILTYTGLGVREEFKTLYDEFNFTGLRFKLLYQE